MAYLSEDGMRHGDSSVIVVEQDIATEHIQRLHFGNHRGNFIGDSDWCDIGVFLE